MPEAGEGDSNDGSGNTRGNKQNPEEILNCCGAHGGINHVNTR